MILMAAATLFVLFLLSIDGRLGDFLSALTHHAGRTSLPVSDAVVLFFSNLASNFGRATAAVALCITAASAWLAVRVGHVRPLLTLLAVLVGVLLTSGIVDVSRSELRFTAVLIWAAAAAAWLSRGAPSASLAVGLIAVGFVWDHRSSIGIYAEGGRPDPAQSTRIRALVEAEPHRRYLVDSFVARHVFDYQLPANARDWTFGRPFPRMWPESVSELQPAETWIVAGYNFRMIHPASAPNLEPVFTFFGRSLTRRPGDHDVMIVDGGSAPADLPPSRS